MQRMNRSAHWRGVSAFAGVIAASLIVGCGRSDTGNKHNAAASGNKAAATTAAVPSGNGGAATVTAGIKGPIDPCKLLMKADAQKVLGAPVTDGRINHETGFAPSTKCSYFTSAPMEVAGGVWGVSVDVADQATFEKQGSYFKSPTQYFQRTRKGMNSVASSRVTNIKGVGDDAFWEGGQLYILDHGVELEIRVNANFHIPPGTSEKVDAEEDAAELHAATSLAKTVVLPRLEKM